jgi:hypothetical protein
MSLQITGFEIENAGVLLTLSPHFSPSGAVKIAK